MANPAKKQESYQVSPIGRVRREKEEIRLEILAEYRPALKELDQFSHVMVFWWADRFPSEEVRAMLQTKPPYAEDHVTGIFATRAPYRPNPLVMTTCKILKVDEENGVVYIKNIDALDGTSILDLKAYFPVCDRVKDASIPPWLVGWPEWMPDEGIGLEEWEEEG